MVVCVVHVVVVYAMYVCVPDCMYVAGIVYAVDVDTLLWQRMWCIMCMYVVGCGCGVCMLLLCM